MMMLVMTLDGMMVVSVWVKLLLMLLKLMRIVMKKGIMIVVAVVGPKDWLKSNV